MDMRERAYSAGDFGNHVDLFESGGNESQSKGERKRQRGAAPSDVLVRDLDGDTGVQQGPRLTESRRI